MQDARQRAAGSELCLDARAQKIQIKCCIRSALARRNAAISRDAKSPQALKTECANNQNAAAPKANAAMGASKAIATTASPATNVPTVTSKVACSSGSAEHVAD